MERVDDPLIGQVIDGRYRIERLLAAGGMGRVYRASQLGAVSLDVAIKILTKELARNRELTQRFENEARIIAQLRHPNTLRMLDSGRLKDGRLYIVTELLTGRTLDEILKQEGRLSPIPALGIARQIADALAEAHERGIIHRDLKPGNVFVEPVSGRDFVRILDFGIAKMVHAPGLTTSREIFGTPGYMAPEQCRCLPIDHRADIYALGVLLYRSLAGHLPFEGAGIELLVATASDSPRPLSKHALDLPEESERLVMQMLAKDPADRPSSASQVRSALEDLLHAIEWAKTEVRDQPSTKVTEVIAPPSKPQAEVDPIAPWMVKAAAVAAVIAAVAISGITVYVMLSERSAAAPPPITMPEPTPSLVLEARPSPVEIVEPPPPSVPEKPTRIRKRMVPSKETTAIELPAVKEPPEEEPLHPPGFRLGPD